MRQIFVFAAAIGVFSALACAGSKQAAPHPMAGSWDYTINAPEEVFKGVLTLVESDSGLVATLRGRGSVIELPLDSLLYQQGTLSFYLTTNQYGTSKASVTQEGDRFTGKMDNITYDVCCMDFTGSRPPAEE